MLKKIVFLNLVILSLSVLCINGVIITPSHENIYYTGRIDKSNLNKYAFAWSGVEISIQVTGTSFITPVMQSSGPNYFNVLIDSVLFPMINVSSDTPQYYNITDILVLNPQDTYNIILTKRTEPMAGTVIFYGFDVDHDATILPYPNIPTRTIELIGDSITCGYGDLGVPPCNWVPPAEDIYMSYGSLIARELDAKLYLEAWSGKGVVRNYGTPNITSNETIPMLYPLTIPTESSDYWDFQEYSPDAVVINLGTNDYDSEPHPPKHLFEKVFIDFINFIKTKYSDRPPTFFLICGPMISDPCCTYVENIAKQVDAIYIDMQGILNTHDYGCNGHPNLSGHAKMAIIALPIIQKNMGWV